jgi:hypothetical protein
VLDSHSEKNFVRQFQYPTQANSRLEWATRPAFRYVCLQVKDGIQGAR